MIHKQSMFLMCLLIVQQAKYTNLIAKYFAVIIIKINIDKIKNKAMKMRIILNPITYNVQ